MCGGSQRPCSTRALAACCQRLQVVFCFHGNAKHTLPPWVLAQGQECPDIFYTDREGNRNTECLSLGVNDGAWPSFSSNQGAQAFACCCHTWVVCCITASNGGACGASLRSSPRAFAHVCSAVPVLAGRTAVQAYSELLAAFGRRYGHLLGGTVTDAEIGLGPQGELRYPSSPSDSRWSFPGVGEFQVCAA